jgi:DNA-binding NarL/FixJ family response regulator
MEFRYEELVENEKVIGRLLVQGLTVKAIAAETGISKRVVTTHIRNMKVKLQATDLADLRHLLQWRPDKNKSML